jgi:hypothetical protein
MYVGEDSWASGGIVDVPIFEAAWADESFPVVGPYSMAKEAFHISGLHRRLLVVGLPEKRYQNRDSSKLDEV